MWCRMERRGEVARRAIMRCEMEKRRREKGEGVDMYDMNI